MKEVQAMEVFIILGDDEIEEEPEARRESEPGIYSGGRNILARAVVPNLEHLRDRGPDWQMLRDLNNPFKW